MANRRISTIVMSVLGVLMLVSLFLPYLRSTVLTDYSVSVVSAATETNSEIVEEDSKTLYMIITAAVAIGSLFALLSLTGKKVFGVFSIIVSFLIAAFQGLLTAGLSEERDVVPGLGFWLLLGISLVLFVTSIVFVARKPKLA